MYNKIVKPEAIDYNIRGIKISVRVGDCGETFIVMRISVLSTVVYDSISDNFYHIAARMGSLINKGPDYKALGKDNEGYYVYINPNKPIKDNVFFRRFPDIKEIAQDAMAELLIR